MTTVPTTTRDIYLPDEPDHPALADRKGIELVQAIHDRKNATKAGPSSAMAETGRRGSESPDRLGGSGDGGR